MLSRKIRIAGVTVTAILASLPAGCLALQQAPRFIDTPNGVAYRLGSYNNIFAVKVQAVNSDKVLWQVEHDAGPTRFEKFDYAKSPENMREVVPAQPLKVGDRVMIEVKYQYDQAFAPCVGSIHSVFEVAGASTFRRVGAD